jgi:phage gp36-like protein
MAYSTYEDVRLDVPQAPEGEVFTGWITQADGVIDAHLRTYYDVPLSAPVPQLVVNCSAKLAASYYMKAKYSQINQAIPERAESLGEEAMKILQDIKDNPSLLGLDLRDPTTDDYDTNAILTEGEDSKFTTGDETTWGYD